MIAAHGWAAGAAVPARACQQMMGRHRPGERAGPTTSVVLHGRPGARRFRYPCNETSIQVRSLVLRRVTTRTGAKHPAIVRRTQHGGEQHVPGCDRAVEQDVAGRRFRQTGSLAALPRPASRGRLAIPTDSTRRPLRRAQRTPPAGHSLRTGEGPGRGALTGRPPTDHRTPGARNPARFARPFELRGLHTPDNL
jgi:hypothetical protein